MRSKLLPGRAEVATPLSASRGFKGSNLTPGGSSLVAGWVAGWIRENSLTYGVMRLRGSRCSTFLNKLRVEKGRRQVKRIGITMGASCYTCYPGVWFPQGCVV